MGKKKKFDNTQHNYIYTKDDRFKPIRPLHYNKMSNNRHDKLVKILKNDIINNGADLVTWNTEYGWEDRRGRKRTSPIGELDVQEYCDDWKALGIYEAKGTNNYNSIRHGKKQLNRVIDNYLQEFDRCFDLELKHLYTFIVNLPNDKSYKYRIRPHRHIKL